LIGLALIILIAIICLVSIISYLIYTKNNTVILLMLPYLLWLLFASYLNFYVWLHN
jgi:tryptophan-rich sensory protein